MPVHDWTKVNAGTFHDFHLAWIAELRRILNNGLLPEGFYALAEQVAATIIPDVLTLQETDHSPVEESDLGGLAVATAEPKMAVKDSISETLLLATRRRRLVIRHTTGDRIVALLEIVSQGNKEKRSAVDQFIEKAAGALDEGLQLLMIDLYPPGRFDEGGLHGVLWAQLGGHYSMPDSKPLTLAAYAVAGRGGAVNCYVEPIAVGDRLIDMPLFLSTERYVNVPLESTYMAAYEGVPKRWKRVIEAQA